MEKKSYWLLFSGIMFVVNLVGFLINGINYFIEPFGHLLMALVYLLFGVITVLMPNESIDWNWLKFGVSGIVNFYSLNLLAGIAVLIVTLYKIYFD